MAISTVAGILRTGLLAQNVYLQFKQDTYYIPMIRRYEPNYARLNIPGSEGYGDYKFGGGGATGLWNY